MAPQLQLDELVLARDQVEAQLNVWRGQAQVLDRQIGEAAKESQLLVTDIVLYEKAMLALEELEKTWRGPFEDALAGIISQGLTAIFEQTIRVIMETTTKRGAAHLDIELETEGLRTGIMGSKGGSVVNVIAAFMRMIMTIRNRPALRRFGAWDEPFSMVSAEFRPALCSTLQEAVRSLGFQLLVASHEDELLDACDAAYHILKDGKGTAKRLKAPAEEEVLM